MTSLLNQTWVRLFYTAKGDFRYMGRSVSGDSPDSGSHRWTLP